MTGIFGFIDWDVLAQLGVGGLFAVIIIYFVIRSVFGFLNKQRELQQKAEEVIHAAELMHKLEDTELKIARSLELLAQLRDINEKLDSICDVCHKQDEDGRKRIYVREDLYQQVADYTSALGELKHILKAYNSVLDCIIRTWGSRPNSCGDQCLEDGCQNN